MRIADIEFPEGVLASLRAHELVIFAGNGVSRGDPARLPSFSDLAAEIAKGTPLTPELEEEEDHFLGRLADGGTDVHTLAANVLERNGPQPTDLHRNLLRLYESSDKVRIVTTNFDLLFENAATGEFAGSIESYSAPALPLGRDFAGIVHVHGSLRRPNDMVLTDRDFGRAYLTEGWARRFLSELFRTTTVLIIGYGHDDTIVKYLARALPERGAGKRYVLTSEDNRAKWASLGIEPISFPKASRDDYDAQSRGVRKLATIVRRSILDWQREIAELAANKPPLDEDACATLEYALKNADTTRFFTAVAADDEWIEWLNDRGYLLPMFGTDNAVLSERDFLIANWLGDKFSVNGSLALVRLIAKSKVPLNAHLWFNLCRQVGKPKQAVDAEITRRWVSLLLAGLPGRSETLPLTWLAEKAVEIGDYSLALIVYDRLTDLQLSLAPGLMPDASDTSSFETSFEVDIRPTGDTYQLSKLGDVLCSSMEELGHNMLSIVTTKLSHAHALACSWSKAATEWDPSSFKRAAIEPHDQDRYPDSLDPLIDMARDCLKHIMTEESDDRQYWCGRLASSDAPLLRRLAVFAVHARTDLSPDAKIVWMVENNSIRDVNLHHELFALVKSAYPSAGKNSRARLIECICSDSPVNDDVDDLRTNDYEQYNWLTWILQADPNCETAKAALAAIVVRHPDFAPRGHPDLTHWIGEFSTPEPSWSVDQLIARAPDYWLPILLSENDDARWSRSRVIQTLAEASKQEPRWGLDFAHALAAGEHWKSDLWDGLISAWGSASLDEDKRSEVLDLISRPELSDMHSNSIADALHGLVKNGEKNISQQSLTKANATANALWPIALAEEFEPIGHDWLTSAINSPAGQLAHFWLSSLAVWRHQQGEAPSAMNAEYRAIFDSIVAAPGAAGLMARSIMCAQLSFMLSADSRWTREHLIGLFASETEGHNFDAAWDGFLTWGRLTPAVAECMEPLFRTAVQRMERAPERRRRRFLEYYAIMVAYFGDDPIQGLIPDLFAYASSSSREQFAYQIEHLLGRMTEPHQEEAWSRWLERYWTNRLVGIPVPLDGREISVMLRWLLHLHAVLPAAVDIATRMKPVEMQDPMIIYQLGSGEVENEDIAYRYPHDVAKLLVHLSKCAIPIYAWRDAASLIDRLLMTPLPDALAIELQEVKARFGL
jgi:hypothetical protein